MITMEMASMASRLTEQARQDASAKIERWRGAIDVVRQAEKQADMTINLPTQLTAAANRAASAIHTADYVSAVGMAQQAVEARQQVLNIATEAVEQEEWERSDALEQATSKLETVQQAHTTTIRGYEGSAAPEPPDTLGLGKTGCGTGIGLLILGIIGGLLKLETPAEFRIPLSLLFLAFTFFGWATIPLIAWLIYIPKFIRFKRKVSSKIRSSAADHEMRIPNLRAEVDNAKKELDKVTAAQRLIQTQ